MTDDKKLVKQPAEGKNMNPVAITFLLSSEGKVWLAERTAVDRDFCGLWAAPGGGIEEGERPVQGAAREVEEETGLVIDHGRFLHAGVMSGYKTDQLYWFLVDLKAHEVPTQVEPTKQGEWTLYDLNALPPLPPDSEKALVSLLTIKRTGKPVDWNEVGRNLLGK